MLSVPSVTMNAGSFTRVMSAPLRKPKAVLAISPQRIARSGLISKSTASLVITIDPSAISMPQERSIPAVRMTRVCPIATTPTTITCWRMSEKLDPLRNRSLCEAKKPQQRNRAPSGRGVATGAGRSRSLPRAGGAVATSGITVRSLAPAVRGAELRVLAVHAGHGLVGDERDAGVGVAGRLLSGLRVLDPRIDAHDGHLERGLLRGRGEVAGLHVLHAHAD